MQIFFFYPPYLADAAFAAEGIALHGSLAQSQGPRTAADWFLLQGMPINNAPCARKRPYYSNYYNYYCCCCCLLDCWSRHMENSCIQFCDHEHFVVGNAACLLSDICLLLVGWFMNRLHFPASLFVLLHEYILFSTDTHVGHSPPLFLILNSQLICKTT